jgi:hypothetical protein
MAPMRRTAPSNGSRCSGRQVARAEPQQALHDLQVVLDPVVDLPKQHLALGRRLALLGERFLGGREQPRVELAEDARRREALVGDAALHDGVEQEHRQHARKRQAQGARRDHRPCRAVRQHAELRAVDACRGDPTGDARAPERRRKPLAVERLRDDHAGVTGGGVASECLREVPPDELAEAARAGQDAAVLVGDGREQPIILDLLLQEILHRLGFHRQPLSTWRTTPSRTTGTSRSTMRPG